MKTMLPRLLLAIGFVLGGYVALHLAGEAYARSVARRPFMVEAVEAAALLAACTIVAMLLARRSALPQRVSSTQLVLALALLLGGISYPFSLRAPLEHQPCNEPWENGLHVYRPHAELSQPVGSGGFAHTNGRGFRGADWADRKEPGVRRIVTIGDSFVYGHRVRDRDTLAVRLSEGLGPHVEVLNLGLLGTALLSFTEVLEASARLWSPDLAVLCMSFPDDLVGWDLEVEHRDAATPSIFSATRFLLGERGADAAFNVWFDMREFTSDSANMLEMQVKRIGEIRAAHGDLPLVVFLYGKGREVVAKAFAQQPKVLVLANPSFQDEDFIPGDGHPSAVGNSHFAKLIIDGMARWESGRP